MKIKNLVRSTLLTTTSLVALSFATNAFSADVAVAQEVDEPVSVSVGGYFTSALLMNSTDATGVEENPLSVGTDGEIQFTAEATLESGITVGVRVELEAFTAGDQIDEHYIYANAGFGSFKLGADDGANDFIPGTNDYGIATGNDDPTFGGIVGVGGTSKTITGDSNKLTYISPSLSGFKAGFSFTPHTAASGGSGGSSISVKNSGDLRGVIGVAASYSSSFSGFGIKLGGGLETGKNDNVDGREEKSVMAVGGGVSYAGASINARFSIVTDKTGNSAAEIAAGTGAPAAVGDAQKTNAIAVSGTYSFDDFTVGVGFTSVKRGDDTGSGDYGYDAVRIGGGVKYDLGSGVTTALSFASESTKTGLDDTETKGTLIALELGASF